MAVIPDGRHDVLVVDAQTDEKGSVHLELALTAGPNKGDVVRLVMAPAAASGQSDVTQEPGGNRTEAESSAGAPARSSRAQRDPIDLLGLPGTLVVEDGRPRLTFD